MRLAYKIAYAGIVPTLLAVIGSPRPALAGPFEFTAGDLVVSVEGNGTGTAAAGSSATGNTGSSAGLYLDNQAAPLSLEEFSTSGTGQTPLGNLVLPQTTTPGGNYAVSGEYGSSSEATLQLTGNGRYLTIMGYGVNAQSYNSASDLNGTGTSLAQSCSLSSGCGTTPQVQRVIAEIGANGSVNSTTALYNIFNENNPRSIYSADGTSFYVSGQGNHDSTGGVFYVPSLGATTATPITGADTNSKSYGSYGQDTRDVQIVNGTLTVSVDSTEGTASKGYDIDRIGTLGAIGSPPTTTLDTQPGALAGLNGEITLSSGSGNSINHSTGGAWLSPESFFFANSTTLYVADSGDPKNGNGGDATDGPSDGGLQKWTWSNGEWQLDYTLSANLNLADYTTASCATSTASTSENAPCTTGLYSLTGEVAGGEVELFATSYTLGDDNASYLYGITDVLADKQASQVTGEAFTELAEAPADSDFKGVAFAPVAAVPESSTLALLIPGIAGLGVFGWRRRSVRRAS